MLNIELNDTAIKIIMSIVALAMIVVIFGVLAPKAYKTEATNERNANQAHKAWIAANTNQDADKDVYY